MSDRISAIKAMLEKTPDDVFLHYSLGMEYASAGRHDEGACEFRRCVELDGNYLPAYVEAGKCLRSSGRLAEAREIFAAGMALAAMQGQTHMQDYIRQQLEGLARR
jgi:tetratricopeptide (TPR) repeat protein